MMNSKFGVELECFNVQMQTVVDALNAAGIPSIRAGYSGSDYSKFQIKHDGSIQGRDGFEVVSPILQGEEGIQGQGAQVFWAEARRRGSWSQGDAFQFRPHAQP